jgi:hypothetical protein
MDHEREHLMEYWMEFESVASTDQQMVEQMVVQRDRHWAV